VRTIELDVVNPSGLHARPAAMFVRAAGAHRSRIRVSNVTRGTGPADAKSLLGVLGLGVSGGHRIAIEVDGEDEDAAIEGMAAAVAAGLGEALEPSAAVADAPAPSDPAG
jgi:phosphotransferase system HPr (HPr) family protein